VEEGEMDRLGDGPVPAPSPTATARLRDAVAQRTGDLRHRTEVDLTIAAALVEAGEDAAASDVIGEYQRVLRAWAQDLDRIVGAAAAEREAEAVLDEAIGEPSDLTEPAEVLDAAGPPPSATSRTDPHRAPAPHPPRRAGVRRVLSGALTAAVIAAAVLTPQLRAGSASTQLAAAEGEARAELDIARQRLSSLQEGPAAPQLVTAEARELHDRILALPPAALEREVVREQVRQLLDLERTALEEVAADSPDAVDLLDEIRAIRASLALDEVRVPGSTPLPAAVPEEAVEEPPSDRAPVDTDPPRLRPGAAVPAEAAGAEDGTPGPDADPDPRAEPRDG
jgi:hypothetical protein